MSLLDLRVQRNVTKRLRVALPFVALLLAACGGQPALPPQPGNEEPPGFFPTQPITEQGQYVFDFYPVVFWIAVAVFILVEGLLIWIALRYRRRPTDTELPAQTHGNNMLEILWTLIPALIVTGLFVFTVDTLGKVERTAATGGNQPSVIVDVTGFQWQWTFEYADQGVTLTGSGQTGPNMVLPINETVRIRLHATDVIHSFYVPQFLYKKDVIPGRVNEFDVVLQEPGVYAGQCAEFCGLGHADMHFTVQAVPRAEFDAWIVEQQQVEPSAPPPPSGAPTVSLTSISVTEGFDPSELTIPPDQPWVVQLTNADPAVPHDFGIRAANPDKSDWLGDPDAPGGGSATYQPPPLPAGEYQFFCTIHPNMVGTLRAGQ